MANGEVFSEIAAKYDRINHILSLGQDSAWRESAIRRLPPGKVLDLGAGTGAANPAFGDRMVVALDPAPEMLSLNPIPHKVVGVGERLPFADRSFDAVFSAYVFRNLDSVTATLAEIARVLRPGGRAGVVDLGRPTGAWQTRMHRMGTAVVLNSVGLAFGAREEYRYLNRSLDDLPPPEEMYGNGPMRIEALWRMGTFGFVYGVVLARD